ncbi:hypothetical protein [Pseudoxanthomonas winnipegensis]|uniref:hypothetical protein n=1 Tax=Pseudoxanthomonas winnipegensis TaxID=2480810 RepID=UPI00103D60CB|nr:hypothetical protein [Pseudoxanthomonas winnipegensis]TBV76917.1 hypothetical protein EYC45_01755 [Pseudoxanthomonas winnipegensis]
MKWIVRAAALTLALMSFHASAMERVHAKINRVFSEANRFAFSVTDSDVPHPCGGVFYEVYRNDTAPHFEEMYSMALVAFTNKSSVEIVVRGCADGDRVLVDHMGIY